MKIQSSARIEQRTWRQPISKAFQLGVYRGKCGWLFWAQIWFNHIVRATNGNLGIKFVNTSMHGVGHPFVERAFESFGFPPFIPVKQQQVPDPEFPTVKFPNPEEKGTPPEIRNTIHCIWTLNQAHWYAFRRYNVWSYKPKLLFRTFPSKQLIARGQLMF